MTTSKTYITVFWRGGNHRVLSDDEIYFSSAQKCCFQLGHLNFPWRDTLTFQYYVVIYIIAYAAAATLAQNNDVLQAAAGGGSGVEPDAAVGFSAEP